MLVHYPLEFQSSDPPPCSHLEPTLEPTLSEVCNVANVQPPRALLSKGLLLASELLTAQLLSRLQLRFISENLDSNWTERIKCLEDGKASMGNYLCLSKTKQLFREACQLICKYGHWGVCLSCLLALLPVQLSRKRKDMMERTWDLFISQKHFFSCCHVQDRFLPAVSELPDSG